MPLFEICRRGATGGKKKKTLPKAEGAATVQVYGEQQEVIYWRFGSSWSRGRDATAQWDLCEVSQRYRDL